MIELKNVSKNYGKRQAVRDVSLTIGQGEIVGLFGENGAGKSTLIKCILGEPISRKNIDRLSFATSEHSFFPALSPEGHADFYAEHFPRFDRKRFDVLMDFFELPRKGAPSKLSTGQKNQFEVVLALSQGADYILMDEPFSGNDVFNREDFYKVLLGIMEPNETVILSTHLIEEVEGFIGRALLIHKGRLVGDVQMSELEETGEGLIDFVKRNYGYRAERIRKAISELSGDE